MKMNLPVTNNEYVIRDDALIVSMTDLKGIITEANPDFIEASGYTEEELLRKPHNILRHPDMPAEGFADLWATIKQGKPWIGVVKNRRKNGDYYWVVANVTPIRQGTQITGYLSVRGKATRAQIEAANTLYAAIREGKAAHLLLEEGRVVRAGKLAAFWRRLGNASIGARLASMGAFTAALIIGVAAVGVHSTDLANQALQSAHDNRMEPVQIADRVLDHQRKNSLTACTASTRASASALVL